MDDHVKFQRFSDNYEFKIDQLQWLQLK